MGSRRIESAKRQMGRSSGYFLAAATVTAAYVLRLQLESLLDGRVRFLIFVVPVLFCALAAGRGPAILAAILSLGAGLALFLPERLGTVPVLVEAGTFAIVSIFIVWIAGRFASEKRVSEWHRLHAEDEAVRAHRTGEELRLMLEGATHYAIFTTDIEGRITTWNSAAERLFGWSEAEILGRDCAIFYGQERAESEKAAADLGSAFDSGRFSDEIWQIRKDGSEFLADVTITALKGAEGEVRSFGKMVHDVTDRRAAERALEKREQHLQSILATVPDAMIVIDERGIMISFSAAAERLFGYAEADVLGRNVSMLMPNPDRERHDAYLQRYLDTRIPHIIGIGRIVTGLRADGSTFPMKLSVGEALSEDQRLFTGFVQDLTERKDFEARLEQLKSELIHVSRLSAMGTMASTLAHELNQPLTAIASYAEAAGDLLKDPDEQNIAILREAFSDLVAQSLRAGAIVRRLRDFVARGETAKSVEDLPALINEASALALVGSRERGISANFHYAPDATPVLVDKVQIQQVLINLMRNAIEAMEICPARKLSVTTSLIDPATVQVSVADTGPGISPEMQERLFEAFASTKSNGMGLGLSICRTIVEAHGGRIRAVRADGGGTEFQFTLARPTMEPG
ncbi:PAS domain S-box protein [Sphingosinicella rhizophila]|uniref:histidine kinase n=1 Tax=Sphingosinicella rhizophila TaxID=3050082 RepID=A0ABU3Q6R4_9SPHN|nr:PAS domain S-box protein [Sphingosinicella sp. GR2756]MDT9599007.1 PAS domain S-box protein [Sphingosinicella sp. GR2756]